MAPVQTQPRPTSAHPAAQLVIDAMAAPGPKVWDDMTVEVALSVMAGAHVRYLTVCDEDDRRTGLVTHAQLTAVRDSALYTDRLRLRDVPDSIVSSSSAPGRTTGAQFPAYV